MADQKTTQLTELTTPDSSDELMIVDKSDTTMAASGTNKRIKFSNIATPDAVLNSDTSTTDMQFVIDEDDMASDSATKVPSQQSVKAFVANSLSAGLGIALMGQGTLASRPSATGQPNGITYFATDDVGGTLYKVQSNAWVKVAPSLGEISGKVLAIARPVTIGGTTTVAGTDVRVTELTTTAFTMPTSGLAEVVIPAMLISAPSSAATFNMRLKFTKDAGTSWHTFHSQEVTADGAPYYAGLTLASTTIIPMSASGSTSLASGDTVQVGMFLNYEDVRTATPLSVSAAALSPFVLVKAL